MCPVANDTANFATKATAFSAEAKVRSGELPDNKKFNQYLKSVQRQARVGVF